MNLKVYIAISYDDISYPFFFFTYQITLFRGLFVFIYSPSSRSVCGPTHARASNKFNYCRDFFPLFPDCFQQWTDSGPQIVFILSNRSLSRFFPVFFFHPFLSTVTVHIVLCTAEALTARFSQAVARDLWHSVDTRGTAEQILKTVVVCTHTHTHTRDVFERNFRMRKSTPQTRIEDFKTTDDGGIVGTRRAFN